MIRTAQRRFVRHVCLRCLRNLFLLFLLGFSSIHSLQRQVPQCVPPALHYACIMLAQDPMPLSKILDLSLMQKSIIGLVTELWSVSKVSYGILEYAFYHLPGRLLKCVEIEQQWVGSGAASLSATRVRKM